MRTFTGPGLMNRVAQRPRGNLRRPIHGQGTVNYAARVPLSLPLDHRLHPRLCALEIIEISAGHDGGDSILSSGIRPPEYDGCVVPLTVSVPVVNNCLERFSATYPDSLGFIFPNPHSLTLGPRCDVVSDGPV